MSSASEWRSDHPPGESGLAGWWNGVWAVSGKKVGSMIFEASCGSRSRRASHLCGARERLRYPIHSPPWRTLEGKTGGNRSDGVSW